jgi:hypothetical protein
MIWKFLTGALAASFLASTALAEEVDATTNTAPEAVHHAKKKKKRAAALPVNKEEAKAPAPAEKPLIALPEPNLDFLSAGFDYAYGAKFMSDYLVRGISNSAHRPAGNVYGELRYGWLYAGTSVTNVTLPTSPLAEVDIYGGIRPTWGPLTLDFGAIYYAYPSNHQQWWLFAGAPPVATFRQALGAAPTTAFDPSYVEIYFKPSWALNDYLTLGGQLAYAPSWNNYGAHALYSEINAKVTPFANTDYSGFSISGAFGHYYLGMATTQYGQSYIDPDPFVFANGFSAGTKGFKFASYNTWNVGASYNWNMVTLDLRYYDSNLTRAGCFINTSDPSGNFVAALSPIGQSSSSWCGQRFVASLSIDFTSATFK